MSSHLTPEAQHAVDEARAVMASKRASCCRHGVNRDRCADCQRNDERTHRAHLATTQPTEIEEASVDA